MVRFLVEHGACIFATTLSDHETAAEKCEEDEEGFDGCSEYLYSKSLYLCCLLSDQNIGSYIRSNMMFLNLVLQAVKIQELCLVLPASVFLSVCEKLL
jgi:hypothetical protein